MNGYVCFYDRKRFEVCAETIVQAKESAIKYFKIPKSKIGLLVVALAETDGKPVSHSTSF